MTVDDVVAGSSIGDDRLPELMELYRSTWWAKERSQAEVAKMVAGSDLMVTRSGLPARVGGVLRALGVQRTGGPLSAHAADRYVEGRTVERRAPSAER